MTMKIIKYLTIVALVMSVLTSCSRSEAKQEEKKEENSGPEFFSPLKLF